MNSNFYFLKNIFKSVLISLLSVGMLPSSAQSQTEESSLKAESNAEAPLQQLAHFHGESGGVGLRAGCMSPGDMDGDGFSEVYVAEVAINYRLLMYKGGNPADTEYDKVIPNRIGTHNWIPDINGDGIEDLAIQKPKEGNIEEVEVWFGGLEFFSKENPDIVFYQGTDTVSAFGHTIYSGDVNGDNQNDIVMSAVNLELPPFDGRFTIFFGGNLLDTIADAVINFYLQEDGYHGFRRGSALGDINNDGLLDFGYSMWKNPDELSYLGIIFGSIPLDTLPDLIISTPFKSHYDPGHFGGTIVPLGDINKDGFDDFVVGGQTVWPCIFYGGDPFDTIPTILGDTTDDLTVGDRIANIGDINHDGWDDIGVGFVSYNFGDGIFYIYFGAYQMDTEADLTIIPGHVSPSPAGHFGESVGPAGDFNGDGVDDVIISSSQWLMGGAGNVYVLGGDPDLPTPAEDEPDIPIPEKNDILRQNYPNPFNNRTVIEYNLQGISEREVEIKIYNILGQKVRTLYNGHQSGGRHSLYWDGRDDSDNDVPSGIYFYQLKSRDQIISKKMLYLK